MVSLYTYISYKQTLTNAVVSLSDLQISPEIFPHFKLKSALTPII